MQNVASLLGLGLYSIPEVARLICVPARSVRRWVKGYAYKSRGGKEFSAPVVRHQLLTLHEDDILTFAELIELHFVAVFRERGIGMDVIRDAADFLSRVWETDYPFSVEKLYTSGKEILGEMATTEKHDQYPYRFVQALHNQQLTFSDLVEPYLQKIDYRDAVAHQYWPLGKNGRVVLDPARSFGKPIDDKTGMRTFILYQASFSGASYPEIASWYGVPVEAVERAVEYERALKAA